MRSLAILAALLALTFVGASAQNSSTASTRGLTGKWHVVFDTSDGTREFDAQFTVADGKVGGTFGKYNDEVKGTIDGEKFALEFPTNSDEAGKGILKLTGKIADEKLSGSWSFQTYDGTFAATRLKTADSAGGH
jgi:hypothetical protein